MEFGEPMEKNQSQSAHVLIIDDDLDQLRLLVATLRNTSYRISVALNGDQGYARATVLQPDLILLDVCMPGRSGITIARLLKNNPSTQRIPIIFLSALTDAPERIDGLRAGAVDYITKPFCVDEILERIRIHLELDRKSKLFSINDPAIDSPNDASNPADFQSARVVLRQIAVDFIFNRIHESCLKISDVAANLGVSTQRLNAVFETSDGMTAFEFMRRERMRRAALMLGQSTLTISEVGMEVGYANPANFSTEFKKFWGESPTKLRNKVLEDAATLQKLIASKFHASHTPPADCPHP